MVFNHLSSVEGVNGMRRLWVCLLVLLFLPGCSSEKELMNEVLLLRRCIQDASEINLQCRITADYGNSVCVFGMECKYDSAGNMQWKVTEPETIAGISGSVKNEKGQFEFDNEMLVFELLTDEQITPVGAPWILLKVIQSGYVHGCGRDGENIFVQFDDSFSNLQFSTDVWLSKQGIPLRGEIIWKGRRI